MKIAVAGTGYVGLSIATLLAQHNVPEKIEDDKSLTKNFGYSLLVTKIYLSQNVFRPYHIWHRNEVQQFDEGLAAVQQLRDVC